MRGRTPWSSWTMGVSGMTDRQDMQAARRRVLSNKRTARTVEARSRLSYEDWTTWRPPEKGVVLELQPVFGDEGQRDRPAGVYAISSPGAFSAAMRGVWVWAGAGDEHRADMPGGERARVWVDGRLAGEVQVHGQSTPEDLARKVKDLTRSEVEDALPPWWRERTMLGDQKGRRGRGKS